MKDKKLREYLNIEEDKDLGMLFKGDRPIFYNEIIECEKCGYLIKSDKAYKKLKVMFDSKKKEEYCVPHHYCKKCFDDISKNI